MLAIQELAKGQGCLAPAMARSGTGIFAIVLGRIPGLRYVFVGINLDLDY